MPRAVLTVSIRSAPPTDDRGVETNGATDTGSSLEQPAAAEVRVIHAQAGLAEHARRCHATLMYRLMVLPTVGANATDYERTALGLGRQLEAPLGALPDLSDTPESRAVHFHLSPELGELPVELMPCNGRPVCLERPLNRLLSSHRARPLQPRQTWKVLLVNGHQPSPPLPWLADEHASLTRLFDEHDAARDIEVATWSPVGNSVTSLLNGIEWADVVHISGHVFSAETPDTEAWIQLDGEQDLRLTASNLATLKSPPRLFWVNGCSSGRSDIGQIARTLTDIGCTHVIGSFLPIGDGPAGIISPHLYRRLLAGAEVGHACLSLRRLLHEQADPAWWSLVCYGLPGRLFAR